MWMHSQTMSGFSRLGSIFFFILIATIWLNYTYYRSISEQKNPKIIQNTATEKKKLSFSTSVQNFTVSSRDDSIFTGSNLLTIFTSFKQVPERDFINRNTIINWASLGSLIKPVFFANNTNSSELLKFALNKKWLGLLQQRTNPHGTPVLVDMYKKATGHVKSMFYGFCNSDILFDGGLSKTLNVILNRFPNETVLVIGRRTNVDVNLVAESLAIHNSSLLRSIARSYGELFRLDAEDYFFISKPWDFPWHHIKDGIVIGRPGYDNYLVAQARKYNVTIVNASETILALHQTGIDGNFAGENNSDRNYNRYIIGPYHFGSAGRITPTKYFTKFNELGNVDIMRNDPE